MPEKKIIVQAWYWTGPPNNRRLRADFIGSKLRHEIDGVVLTTKNVWDIEVERFIPARDIEKIWEE